MHLHFYRYIYIFDTAHTAQKYQCTAVKPITYMRNKTWAFRFTHVVCAFYVKAHRRTQQQQQNDKVFTRDYVRGKAIAD